MDKISSFLENRLNLFYFSAFAPIILISYLNVGWPFAIVIPLYAFVLLLLKKGKLSTYSQTNQVQRLLGLTIIFSSFIAYYGLVIFFPTVSFYGGVNYAIHILGLVFTFFGLSALREAFTPVFLIGAAMSTSFISKWLEHYFTPYIPHFVNLVIIILKPFGIEVTTPNPNYPYFIVLHTLKGPLSMTFVWACVGVTSMLIFSILLVVTLYEESTSIKTKISWGILGILGTFFLNVIRVVIIFLADYYYGSEVGAKVHYGTGYVLFITWLAVFFYLFSKREIISAKIRSIRQKLCSTVRRSASPTVISTT